MIGLTTPCGGELVDLAVAEARVHNDRRREARVSWVQLSARSLPDLALVGASISGIAFAFDIVRGSVDLADATPSILFVPE